eukprot:1781982-Amphidinium_carterae.1
MKSRESPSFLRLLCCDRTLTAPYPCSGAPWSRPLQAHSLQPQSSLDYSTAAASELSRADFSTLEALSSKQPPNDLVQIKSTTLWIEGDSAKTDFGSVFEKSRE